MVSDTKYALLAVDAGNTRIKWGMNDGDGWAATGALPTAESSRLGQAWRHLAGVGQVVASNVAGERVRSDLETACAHMGVRLHVIASERERLGVTSDYIDPGQLGTDRWAALVAAHHARRGNKLVVNVGTALTVDALTDQGRFLGGLIVPSPALMRRCLDRGTAGLRLTEGKFDPLPRCTPDAITAGAIQAAVGAIARHAAAMAQSGCAPDIAIVSGGGSADLSPHLPLEFAIHENLVLDGLALIGRDQ